MKENIIILLAFSMFFLNFATAQSVKNTSVDEKTNIVVVVEPGLRKTYGTDDPEFVYTIVLGELPADVQITGVPERVAGEDAGTYEITQGTLQIDSDDYNLIFVGACLKITKAEIMLKAVDISKKLGSTDPELNYVVEGELPAEVVLTGSIERSVGEAPGKYMIYKGSLSAGHNYEIIFIKGYLTIEGTSHIINLSENKKNQIYAYPNPVKAGNYISIKTKNQKMLSENARIELYNSNGVLVCRQFVLDNENINLYVPTSGNYIVKLISSEINGTAKITAY